MPTKEAFSIKMVLVGVISLYQKTLSPDHGFLKRFHPYGFCRFYPSCSQYAKESIEKHGVLRGLYLSAHRLSRCHPWATPGFDPVPGTAQAPASHHTKNEDLVR